MWTDISHLTLPADIDSITDMYLPEGSVDGALFYPGPLSMNDQPNLRDFAQILIESAREKNKIDFSLAFMQEGQRIIFRGHRIESMEGRIYILRRLPSTVPSVEKLGLPANLVQLMLSDKFNKGGLIIISGETGQGKSTTAGAIIANRLREFASFCMTIEDPVELSLQGIYDSKIEGKKGVCFQTSVEDAEIEEAIRGSMRCYPAVSNSMLFLGETRDSHMALEVLKVAANGHLVITTMHGSDLLLSLKRFMALACAARGINENEVRSLLSSVFRLIVHQTLEAVPTRPGQKRLQVNVLFSPGGSSMVGNQIRSGKLDMLATAMENQQMTLRNGKNLLESIF